MAESSSHDPSSLKNTPKEEPITLDKPKSPNPFLPADQIEFTFEEITFTTNNKVALLYPSHPNSEYFREVPNFISKCCLKEAFIRAPTQYKEYMSEFWNALRAHYLPHSNMYVSTPSITIERPWFATIGHSGEIGAKGILKKSCLPHRWRLLMGQLIQYLDYARLIWEDIIHKLSKKTREKVVPYPRFISLLLEYMMPEYDNEELTINPTHVFSVHNWVLKPNQTEGPPFTDHMKAICNLDVHVDSKSLKPFSHTEETEASKSNTVQSEKETQSTSAKDKSLSHPSPPTPVVGEIHKEAQQAACGPTSLGATSEDGAHPQLSSGTNPSVFVDQTKSARDGLKTAQTDSGTNEESNANEISKKIKLDDLSDLLKDTRSAFFTPDSLQDEPIIVSDESEEEEEVSKDKDTHASSHDVPEDTSIPHPPSLKLAQIQELMDHPELSKLFASHNFASCLPTELKELPSKFTELSEEIKELKQHVKEMEIELPGDLKEILTKLETFTSTISSLTSQVAELKNIQWELLAEFQALPVLVSSVQKQLKTLDSLPSLLNKVTETLNRFATMVENASGATTKDIPSVGQATASPAEGEKNTTKDAETNLQNELVDLLGIDMVEQHHNKKLLFDKYYDKMLKRRKSSKIINCDVITQKGPILLKVYREDRTIEVIANFKVGDLHLAE
ncbi:hypothetical protein Tco_1184093 [Tanacetum coccineum]